MAAKSIGAARRMLLSAPSFCNFPGMKLVFKLLLIVLCPSLIPLKAEELLRVGHFPNLTHAQALVAHQLTRRGTGWFEARMPGVKIEWFTYNAGPSAIEALLANAIDLTFVGPNPALNAYARSNGDEIRVLSASTFGGSALLVSESSQINSAQDFKGKRIATPQFGNSQDIMARSWLAAQGFKITQIGGEVSVLPTANPDQLDLLLRKEIDAVWSVEPWVSVLEEKASARIFLEERDSITTLIATSVVSLSKRPELLKKFTAAAAELTEWINKNPTEAKELIQAELQAETLKRLSASVLDKAWSRIKYSSSITLPMLEQAAEAAHSTGFMKIKPDLRGILVAAE